MELCCEKKQTAGVGCLWISLGAYSTNFTKFSHFSIYAQYKCEIWFKTPVELGIFGNEPAVCSFFICFRRLWVICDLNGSTVS